MCRPKRRKFWPPPGWPTRPDGRPMTQNDVIVGLALHYYLEEEDRKPARSRPRRRVVRNGAFCNI